MPTDQSQVDSAAVGTAMTLGQRLKWLALVQLCLGAVALPIVYVAGGDVAMASVAWSVCLIGTVAGHLASEFPQGNEFVMLRLASAMVCRTLPPMGLAVWGMKFREPQFQSEVILILILAYMSGLVVDSYLSLQRINPVGSNQS